MARDSMPLAHFAEFFAALPECPQGPLNWMVCHSCPLVSIRPFGSDLVFGVDLDPEASPECRPGAGVENQI